jgi:hypothetical protein
LGAMRGLVGGGAMASRIEKSSLTQPCGVPLIAYSLELNGTDLDKVRTKQD